MKSPPAHSQRVITTTINTVFYKEPGFNPPSGGQGGNRRGEEVDTPALQLSFIVNYFSDKTT